jgi:hypothetical protein
VAQASISNLAMGELTCTRRATSRGKRARIDFKTCFRAWWYRTERNKFNDSSTDEEIDDDDDEARL